MEDKTEHGTSFDDVNVLCPFFIASSRKNKVIRCEGPVDRTSVSLRFNRRHEQAAYMERYCNCHYKRCELCRIAEKRWE